MFAGESEGATVGPGCLRPLPTLWPGSIASQSDPSWSIEPTERPNDHHSGRTKITKNAGDWGWKPLSVVATSLMIMII